MLNPFGLLNPFGWYACTYHIIICYVLIVSMSYFRVVGGIFSFYQIIIEYSVSKMLSGPALFSSLFLQDCTYIHRTNSEGY